MNTILDFGKNATPRYAIERETPDGKRSIVYGNTLNSEGKIGDPHGHNVLKGTENVYVRTIGGTVLCNIPDKG